MNLIKLIFTIYSFSFVFLSIAQDKIPAIPAIEKRVYKTAKGKLFVQKELPIYLKFSVSPTGENFSLKSEERPEDSNPMYLDTEGVNYIHTEWAVDKTTKKWVYPKRGIDMEIYADGVAPRTEQHFIGAHYYHHNDEEFYGGGMHIELVSKDFMSGVETTYYALNGAFKKYNEEIKVEKEGSHHLYFFAEDRVGNIEDIQSFKFSVDVTAPVSTIEIIGDSYEKFYVSSSAKIQVNTLDNLSGVDHLWIKYGSKDEGYYYKRPIGLSDYMNGEYAIHYYASDHVQNIEVSKTFKFYVDRRSPKVELKIKGDKFVAGKTFISPRTQFQFEATDDESGIKKIYYRMNGSKSELLTYKEPFSLAPSENRLNTIRFNAADNVNNFSARKSKSFFMDNQAPITSIEYGEPNTFSRDTLYVSTKTPIKFKVREPLSGLKQTLYSLEEDTNNLTLFKDQLFLEEVGYHKIHFKSIDQVNNQELLKHSEIVVDVDPPKIYLNFSIQAIGEKEGVKIYPNDVKMYIDAEDKQAGLKQLMFSVDGAPFYIYKNALKMKSNKGELQKFQVVVKATDKLEISSSKTYDFFIGELEEYPQISVKQDTTETQEKQELDDF